MPEIIEGIKNASYSLLSIWESILAFFAAVNAEENIVAMKEIFFGYIEVVVPYIPFILLAVYLIVTFAGQRLLGLMRFLACFVVGFGIGVLYLYPVVATMLPTLPVWASGVAVGLVCAVLSKLIYFLALIIVPAYSVYWVCFNGVILPELTAYTASNYIFSLIVAAVAVVLVLVLRKLLERIGTAMLGGWGIAVLVLQWYDYRTLEFFVGQEWLAVLSCTLIIALIGFIVQQAKRKRY